MSYSQGARADRFGRSGVLELSRVIKIGAFGHDSITSSCTFASITDRFELRRLNSAKTITAYGVRPVRKC
jgi:hypothetical protein